MYVMIRELEAVKCRRGGGGGAGATRKKEEGRRKKEEGRRKKEEGRWRMEDGRWKMESAMGNAKGAMILYLKVGKVPYLRARRLARFRAFRAKASVVRTSPSIA